MKLYTTITIQTAIIAFISSCIYSTLEETLVFTIIAFLLLSFANMISLIAKEY